MQQSPCCNRTLTPSVPAVAEAPVGLGRLGGELQLRSLILLMHSTRQLGDTQLAIRLLSCGAGEGRPGA